MIFGGVAVKVAIDGTLPAITVTAVDAVTDPKVFVAVRLYACVAEGVTFADVPVTLPIPPSMVRLGDPVTAQLSMLDWPAATFAGVATKRLIVGGLPAVTTSEAIAVPKLFVAVRVQVWVLEGATLMDVPPIAPTPGLMLTLGFPVTVQLSVLGTPAATFAGVATKPVIVGALPACTVAHAVTDPESLVAVST